MAKRHQKKQPASHRLSLPRAVSEAIDQAGQLVERRRFDQALALLADVDRQFPNNFLIQQLIAEAAYETRDDRLFLDASDRMASVVPDDPDVMAQRAYAHLRMGYAFLAQRYFQQVLQRWPDSPISEKARQTIADLQPAIHETTSQMEQAGYPTADVPELAARHEQVQVWLARGKYADARRVATQLLSRWPTFAPALNNVAEAWMREGNLAQAAAATRQTLAVNPDNPHALASLVRLLVLDGKRDEAREAAERLKSVKVLHPDNRVKMAEALALLGDDAGVLAVWADGEQEGFRLQEIHLAYLHHLAAVSAYRSGDEKRARELWASCLRAAPNFTHANGCIEDLDRPVGEQNGPWPCSLETLLSPGILGEIQRRFGGASAAVQDAKIRDDARRFLQQQLQVQTILPLLLERGDPLGREIAVRLAGAARTPQTLAMLRDFALSQHGPDRLRVQAAQGLVRSEASLGTEPRLWVRGEWRPFRLFDAEISREPIGPRQPPRVEKLLAQGSEFLSQNDNVQAETVLRQALALAPDAASVNYNLATALLQQRRDSEAVALLAEIRVKHPDYLFGVLQEARDRIVAGELDEAARLIDSVKGRPRLHVTEFDTLTITNVQLGLVRSQVEAARNWLLLLQAVDPDDPNIDTLRSVVGAKA